MQEKRNAGPRCSTSHSWRDDIMNVVKSSSVDGEKGLETRFRGDVSLKRLVRTASPGSVRLFQVSFGPGSRTFWHRHDGEQMLFVTEGRCLVQSRGGPVVELEAGDVARIDTGEEHWHGAAPETAMEHLAITGGTRTHWLEAVTSID
jgi:quercetin dioxygenase-like cupin family protein